MFDNLRFECDCGGTVSYALDDVARERTVRCSRGCSVKLYDEGGRAASMRRASREFEDELESLDRALRRFGGGVTWEEF